MKTPRLKKLSWNKRIDLRKQELEEVECEEFGKTGKTQGGEKIGYNPLNSICATCKAGLVCMEFADKLSKDQHISLVKSELGVKHFYDENRIKEKGRELLDRIYEGIKSRHEANNPLPYSTFERVVNKKIDEELKSQDPMMFSIIVEVLTSRGVKFSDVCSL